MKTVKTDNEIGDGLVKLLKKAKKAEDSTRNTTLTRDIASVLNKHFKSQEMLLWTSNMVRNDLPRTTNQKGKGGSKKEWVPGEAARKKKETSVTGKKKSKDVVGKRPVTEEKTETLDLTLADYAAMTPQAMIDHFGSLPKVKAFAKEMGFSVDNELEPMDYLTELVAVLRETANSVLDDEEE